MTRSSDAFADVAARLADDAAGTGLFCDFDGTLSEIVDDPAAAVPVAGAAGALGDLVGRYGCVGVLSGRPVEFLRPFFGPGVVLSGLYGLEMIRDGQRIDHPLGGVWREAVDDVAAQSSARGPDGMRVESKGLSLTLHYRGRPEREAEVRAWAEQQAARSGLELRSARQSFELHPPIDVDKGSSLLELAEGLETVCFFGDDVGDLAAFDALDRLAATEVTTVRIGVRSAESAAELLARSDLLVDGPAGVLALLRQLAT